MHRHISCGAARVFPIHTPALLDGTRPDLIHRCDVGAGGGGWWDEAPYSVHPTTQPFVNATVHSVKGWAPLPWSPIKSALC